MAAYDSTAITLAWALHLVSTHPEVQRRLHADVDEVLSGAVPTLDDLPA
jgi:cytochrome P450